MWNGIPGMGSLGWDPWAPHVLLSKNKYLGLFKSENVHYSPGILLSVLGIIRTQYWELMSTQVYWIIWFNRFWSILKTLKIVFDDHLFLEISRNFHFSIVQKNIYCGRFRTFDPHSFSPKGAFVKPKSNNLNAKQVHSGTIARSINTDTTKTWPVC